jgi:pSer/pThr/pTyr-binding forkhead associated (FHA) protein
LGDGLRIFPGTLKVALIPADDSGEVPSPLLIGRSSDCDVVLRNHTVSRRHAEIRAEGEEWIVEDLGSTNGTGVNGEPLHGPTAVHEGDVLTFGMIGMRFSPAGEKQLV